MSTRQCCPSSTSPVDPYWARLHYEIVERYDVRIIGGDIDAEI
jgi:hypothetical protein